MLNIVIRLVTKGDQTDVSESHANSSFIKFQLLIPNLINYIQLKDNSHIIIWPCEYNLNMLHIFAYINIKERACNIACENGPPFFNSYLGVT